MNPFRKTGLRVIAAHGKVNTTEKGNAFEQEFATFLRAGGCTVEVTEINRKIMRGRWVTKKADFWGCIDEIALHPTYEPTLLAQLTDGGSVSEKKNKIDFAIPGNFPSRRVMVVTPGKEPKTFRCWLRGAPGDWREIVIRTVEDVFCL